MMARTKNVMALTVLLLCCVPVRAQGLRVEIESGITHIVKNDFQDNRGGDLVRFTEDFDSGDQLNLRAVVAYVDALERNEFFLRLVFLDYSATAILAREIRFEGETFVQGETATAVSRFNGYRFGWSRLFNNAGKVRYRLGATVNVRDGEISISNGTLRSAFTNDGGALVPLLNAGISYRIAEWLKASAYVESLWAGSAGSLIDLDLVLDMRILGRLSAYMGYRRIQGGVDIDSVPFNELEYNAAIAAIRFQF